MRIALIAALAGLLAACGDKPPLPATISGECRVFTDPGYAVKGKTKRDQFWIDSNLESAYASCGWPRPGKSSR